MNKREDLLGQKFDKLTVIGLTEPKRGKNNNSSEKRRRFWICKCDCGNITEKSKQELRLKLKNGISCGCSLIMSRYNFKDLTGQKFGQLLVKELLEEKTKTRGCLWLCECDCGNQIKLASNSLTSGNTKTCNDKEKHKLEIISKSYYKEIPLNHLNSIKNNATKRNYEYSVTPEYLYELFLKQNRKCVYSGIELTFTKESNPSMNRKQTTASLDRINSSEGYIEGNVQWVHKDINKMKSNKDDGEFVNFCRKIVNNYYFVNRPSWDIYFLNIAISVSHRSEDPNIKHGAVIVDENNHIVGTGYNAFIKGADKNIIPLNNREEKRKWVIHAEENALLNCTTSDKNNLKIYITGEPCNSCLQRLINFGIKKIIMIDVCGTSTENEETRKMKNEIISMSGIEINKISPTELFVSDHYLL